MWIRHVTIMGAFDPYPVDCIDLENWDQDERVFRDALGETGNTVPVDAVFTPKA